MEISNFSSPFAIGLTEVKLGLFNSALNNTWTTAPYSACVLQTSSYPISQQAKHLLFCNAQLSSGVLVLVNVFISFFSFCLMCLVLSDTLLDNRVKQARYALMISFGFTCRHFLPKN